MPSPILARADALMQRRYQSSADQSDLPILTDAIENDDDLPVLNDIASESAPAPREATPADFSLNNNESDTFASELAHQVEQRILAQHNSRHPPQKCRCQTSRYDPQHYFGKNDPYAGTATP